MTEYFIEQLVKRSVTIGTTVKKVGLIALTIIAFLISPLLSAFGPLVIVALIMLDIFLFKRMDIEYEYAFFNGDFDIDKVMGKESRKRLFSVNLKDVDVIAPSGSQEVLGYERLKAINYSTCTPGNKTYELVTLQGSEKVRVIFEPNEKMLNAMKDLAPRKVFL